MTWAVYGQWLTEEVPEPLGFSSTVRFYLFRPTTTAATTTAITISTIILRNAVQCANACTGAKSSAGAGILKWVRHGGGCGIVALKRMSEPGRGFNQEPISHPFCVRPGGSGVLSKRERKASDGHHGVGEGGPEVRKPDLRVCTYM